MADFLTTATVMKCPHGGTVTATTTNTRAKADGAYILCVSDTFSIAGCPFSTGSGPSPCAQVVWSTPASKNIVGSPVLTKDSVGMCIGPSGTQGKVMIVQNQLTAAGE